MFEDKEGKKFERVWASVIEGNEGSCRVLEKAGGEMDDWMICAVEVILDFDMVLKSLLIYLYTS